MKYIKTYEENNNKLEIGDYAIYAPKSDILNYFFEENVGQIIGYNDGLNTSINFYPYYIKYDIKFDNDGKIINDKYNFSKSSFQFLENEDGVRVCNPKNIVFFSKDKKECEAYLEAQKYNL
jgi:hypothetical protein